MPVIKMMNTEGKYIFKTKNTIAEKYEFKFITTIQTINNKNFPPYYPSFWSAGKVYVNIYILLKT